MATFCPAEEETAAWPPHLHAVLAGVVMPDSFLPVGPANIPRYTGLLPTVTWLTCHMREGLSIHTHGLFLTACHVLVGRTIPGLDSFTGMAGSGATPLYVPYGTVPLYAASLACHTYVHGLLPGPCNPSPPFIPYLSLVTTYRISLCMTPHSSCYLCNTTSGALIILEPCWSLQPVQPVPFILILFFHAYTVLLAK